jgi:hypothetical protein
VDRDRYAGQRDLKQLWPQPELDRPDPEADGPRRRGMRQFVADDGDDEGDQGHEAGKGHLLEGCRFVIVARRPQHDCHPEAHNAPANMIRSVARTRHSSQTRRRWTCGTARADPRPQREHRCSPDSP